MKLPEYSLKQAIQHFSGGAQSDPIEFPASTLIQPFWNDHNLPEHVREQLNKARNGLKKDLLVMCLIGRYWIEVRRDNIRVNR